MRSACFIAAKVGARAAASASTNLASTRTTIGSMAFNINGSISGINARRVFSSIVASSSSSSSGSCSNKLKSGVKRLVTALPPFSVREMGHLKKLKTKKGAAKRFILTGKGALKRGHAGKGHLTSGKSKIRKRRLNTKVLLTGTWAKKMKKLLINGK